MKRYFLILIFSIMLICSGFNSVFAVGKVNNTNLPETVPVYLRLMESISSKTVIEGSKIELKVIRNVYNNQNNLVIPYGSIATGIISKINKANYFGRTGLIEIKINSVTTDYGTVELDLNYKVKGGYNIPLLLLGFLAGKNVLIPENEIIVAQLDQSFLVNLEIGTKQSLEEAKIEIEVPTNKSVYSKNTPIQFFVNIASDQKVRTFKLYSNDNLIYEQIGEPGIISLNKNLCRKGEYVLIAKVELENELVICSDEITITID